MTIHLVLALTLVPFAMLSWQEPPPWVAPPVNAKLKLSPTVNAFTGPDLTSPDPPAILHGKLEPSALTGELSGALNGTGDLKIM